MQEIKLLKYLNFLDDRFITPYIIAYPVNIRLEVFDDIKNILLKDKYIINPSKIIYKDFIHDEFDESLYKENEFKYFYSEFLINNYGANINWIKKLSTKKIKKLKIEYLINLIKSDTTVIESGNIFESVNIHGYFHKRITNILPTENILHLIPTSKSIISILKEANWSHSSGPFVYNLK